MRGRHTTSVRLVLSAITPALVSASSDTLTFFLGHLRQSGPSPSAARQYLAAVRHLHLQLGTPLPATFPPVTAAALRGSTPRATQSAPRRQALTINRLRALKDRLPSLDLSHWDQHCVWVACTLAFYGGLRSDEYLSTQPERGLRRSSLHLDSSCCTIRLTVHKTQQSGTARLVSLPANDTSTCPVRSLQAYLVARDSRWAPSAPLLILS